MGRLKSLSFHLIATFLYRIGVFALIRRIVDHVQVRTPLNQGLDFPRIQKRMSRPVQILMYHGVDDAPSPFLPPVPVRQFRNHVQYLSSYCHVLTLDEAVERLQKRDVPHRAVVITLDDGYRDSYTNAYPILKDMKVPATVFLATSAIGTEKFLWHDCACWMITQTTEPYLNGFGSRDRYELSSSEGKRDAQDGVLWYLRSLEDQHRIEAIDRLSSELKVSSEPRQDSRLMLNWQEVKEMHSAGIRFGAHTVNHPILTKIPLTSVVDEIRESKAMIERHVGEPVTTFAYPSGRPQDYNAKIKEVVQQEGFICAVSTVAGSNHEGEDLFDLKRLGYWDHDTGPFGLRFECSRLCA